MRGKIVSARRGIGKIGAAAVGSSLLPRVSAMPDHALLEQESVQAFLMLAMIVCMFLAAFGGSCFALGYMAASRRGALSPKEEVSMQSCGVNSEEEHPLVSRTSVQKGAVKSPKVKAKASLSSASSSASSSVPTSSARRRATAALGIAPEQPPSPGVECSLPDETRSALQCPLCSQNMKLKRARHGGWFWGCSGYPDCRGHREPHAGT